MMNKATVTIYSKPGCHLCDEAKANILAAGCNDDFTIVEVNIEEDALLKERFRYDIPVIFINGIKVFKHRVDRGEFKEKLRRMAR